MNQFIKIIFWKLEDFIWNIRCKYNFWLHGPYGLSRIIEKIPNRYLIKYLRKYGANIGENCLFERAINIHRPFGNKPFENLTVGNNVYLGHNTLIDLTKKVTIKDNVIIASRCQLWTHASYYKKNDIHAPNYSENCGAITIFDGALVFSNTVITHGVTVGSFAKVGAQSLVNKSIGKKEFWAGVPIKKISK